jgi:steroid 5-alpha reductase family enzyme
MDSTEKKSLLAIPVILGIAVAIAWAGSRGGVTLGGLPAFVVCSIAAFALNWLVFVFAYVYQTERYFDLTGSLTYASLVAIALFAQPAPDARTWLLGGLILLWAGRLGSFLFLRVSREGQDGRFDAIKPSAARFAMTWTLQGLWVLLTAACALAAMTSSHSTPLGGIAWTGIAVWVAGFAIEVVADEEKRRFRADPRNRGHFIESGLWAWSRHPNYFGEILLWSGIALIALPALSGWQHATLISPVFVFLLLTRVSGVPLLEARARKRWGDDPRYRAYRARTPVLVPRPPRARPGGR